jgi:uncharacterized protein (DUF488 family)
MTDKTASKFSLFTIGHSNHKMSEFVSLLSRHGVDSIADVRSQPYSRFHGQFNREPLTESLQRADIQYVFLGRELGARRTERECYNEKQARYDRIRRLPAFLEGLGRIKRGLASRRIALLCAERDPITCHRAILVCRELRCEHVDIRHILENGAIETCEQAEARLIEAVGLPPAHLFYCHAELVEQAYDLQAERIAYTESEAFAVTNEEVA